MATEHTTNEIPVSRTTQEVIKEAKRIEEAAKFSSKCHFKAASVWANFQLVIGIPTAALAAIASALVLSGFDSSHFAAGLISVVVAALVAVQTFLNPSERARNHLEAGNNYGSLENRVRIFWTIECWQDASSDSAVSARVIMFADERDKLNRTCPQIPGWAYPLAKRGISRGESSYEVDKL